MVSVWEGMVLVLVLVPVLVSRWEGAEGREGLSFSCCCCCDLGIVSRTNVVASQGKRVSISSFVLLSLERRVRIRHWLSCP